jgi:hypothetical protein
VATEKGGEPHPRSHHVSSALSSHLPHSDQKAMGRQSSPVPTSYSSAWLLSFLNHQPSSFSPRSSCRRSPQNLAPWRGLDPISQPDEIGRAGLGTSGRRRHIGLSAVQGAMEDANDAPPARPMGFARHPWLEKPPQASLAALVCFCVDLARWLEKGNGVSEKTNQQRLGFPR